MLQKFDFEISMDFKFIPLATLLSALGGSGYFSSPNATKPAVQSSAVEAIAARTDSATSDAANYQVPSIQKPLLTSGAVVTWTGRQDDRLSNPDNWEGGRVPTIVDVARFAARSNSVVFDVVSEGRVAGLFLESDYLGRVTLNRDLIVSGELFISSGILDQGNYRLGVSYYRQTGGTFIGRNRDLMIEREAVVSVGTLLTCKSMTGAIAVDRVSCCRDGGPE